MARYIDAEGLKRNIRVNLMPNVDIDGTVTVENAERYFLNLIDKTSTADVVELVRCEKCLHGDVSIIEKTKDGQERWGCYCNMDEVVHSLDWYCPLGMRKEEG